MIFKGEWIRKDEFIVDNGPVSSAEYKENSQLYVKVGCIKLQVVISKGRAMKGDMAGKYNDICFIIIYERDTKPHYCFRADDNFDYSHSA